MKWWSIRVTAVIATASLAVALPHVVVGEQADRAVAVARGINLKAADLPKAMKWSASPKPVSDTATGAHVVRCLRQTPRIGKHVSADPFGAFGRPAGNVVADVPSRDFVSGPQSASSDIAVTTDAQASEDVLAIGTPHALWCYDHTLARLVDAHSIRAAFLPRPAYGLGNHGVHLRFVVPSAKGSEPLFTDAYFYSMKNLEVTIVFVARMSPLGIDLQDAVVETVMDRAESRAG